MNRIFDILTTGERKKLLDLKERLKVKRKGKEAVHLRIQRKVESAKSV